MILCLHLTALMGVWSAASPASYSGALWLLFLCLVSQWDYVNVDMLALQVNIIPIIAKADTIAKNELHKFKSKIMSELVSNGVQIYQFPTDEETVAEINATMSVSRQSSGEQREAVQNARVMAASQRAGQACAGVFSGTLALLWLRVIKLASASVSPAVK